MPQRSFMRSSRVGPSIGLLSAAALVALACAGPALLAAQPRSVQGVSPASNQANGKASTQAGNQAQRAQATAKPARTQQAHPLASLAGEWSGTMRVEHADGMTSTSPIDATIRPERGGAMHAAFAGVSGGKPFDAAAIWRASGPAERAGDAGVEVRWTDSFASRVASATGQAARLASGATMVLEGKAQQPGAPANATLRQSITAMDDMRLVIEWSLVTPAGAGKAEQKQSLLTIDLERLPAHEESMAAASYTDSPLLARLKQGAVVAAQGEE